MPNLSHLFYQIKSVMETVMGGGGGGGRGMHNHLAIYPLRIWVRSDPESKNRPYGTQDFRSTVCI